MSSTIINCKFDAKNLGYRDECNVILPTDGVTENTKVLYLLHGMSGGCHDWLANSTIARLAIDYGIAVVMPNAHNSFYADMVYGENFYTYLTVELMDFVQRTFGLSKKRENNLIAGLSMGGYGAFKIAFNNPHRFYGAGSFSGVLNLVKMPNLLSGDELQDQAHVKLFTSIFGPDFNVEGTNSDLFHLIKENKKVEGYGIGDLDLYQYCGTSDFLYYFNEEFRQLAKEKNLKLTYTSDEQGHAWSAWNQEIAGFLKHIFANE